MEDVLAELDALGRRPQPPTAVFRIESPEDAQILSETVRTARLIARGEASFDSASFLSHMSDVLAKYIPERDAGLLIYLVTNGSNCVPSRVRALAGLIALAAIPDILSPNLSLFRANFLDALVELSREGETLQPDPAALLAPCVHQTPDANKLQTILARFLDAEGYRDAILKAIAVCVTLLAEPLANHLIFGAASESRAKNYDTAIRMLESALAFAPTNSTAWIHKGFYLVTVGQNQEAVASTHRGIALAPDFAPGLNLAVSTMLRAGYLVEAEALARRLSMLPDPEAIYDLRLSEVLLAANRLPEALAAAVQAADRHPADPAVLRRLADLQAKVANAVGAG
jgi:tetratricopeptide (TPR) repeat protein